MDQSELLRKSIGALESMGTSWFEPDSPRGVRAFMLPANVASMNITETAMKKLGSLTLPSKEATEI